MPAKKPPKQKQQPPWTITIRQVEASRPCSSSQYFDCLKLIKSRPIPDGYYDQQAADAHEKFPKKSRYGPDDPIPLSELVALPNESLKYAAELLPSKLQEAIYHRAREIERDSFAVAIRELTAAQKPKGKKK